MPALSEASTPVCIIIILLLLLRPFNSLAFFQDNVGKLAPEK